MRLARDAVNGVDEVACVVVRRVAQFEPQSISSFSKGRRGGVTMASSDSSSLGRIHDGRWGLYSSRLDSRLRKDAASSGSWCSSSVYDVRMRSIAVVLYAALPSASSFATFALSADCFVISLNSFRYRRTTSTSTIPEQKPKIL